MGNATYGKRPFKLGDLSGNRFTIILRDVDADSEALGKAVAAWSEAGYVNYFGLQRFGTGAVPTHTVGLAIIKQDWKEAVNLILKPREGDQHDVQEAREYFAKTADAQGALDRLPHWMSIERGVLEGLAERGPAAYLNALERIPRKMRMMYVHAYQSYIWNHMCTARLTEFDRTKAILGDLVLDPALAFTAASAASAASAAEGETKESMDVEGAGDGEDEEDAGEEEW